MPAPKKLLFLAYYAPPVQVTGNIRRFHLFLAFQQHFSNIFLFTSSNGRLMRQDPSLILPSAQICSIPTYDLRRIILNKKQQNAPTLGQATKSSKSFQLLRRITDSFPFYLLLDDGGPVYIWKAFKKAVALIRQEEVTHIFSSFRPHADHRIAYLLKKKFPNLVWIADFRDLPIDPVQKNVIYPKWQAQWYKKVLKKANVVTTVSHGLARNLRSLHDRVYVLPNAVPPPLPLSTHLFPDQFTITYTGSLYPDLQNLEPLFRAIKELIKDGFITPQQIQLIYAGKDGASWDSSIEKYQLQAINNNKGLVYYDEARRIQQQSHLNLLLSWSGPELTGVLMAKQASYLAAKRPILALINGPEDPEFEAQFENLQAGQIFYTPKSETSQAIIAYLQTKIQVWQSTKALPHSIPPEKLAPLQWEHQVAKFFSFLEVL